MPATSVFTWFSRETYQPRSGPAPVGLQPPKPQSGPQQCAIELDQLIRLAMNLVLIPLAISRRKKPYVYIRTHGFTFTCAC